MEIRRRLLTKKHSILPAGYQQVQYLERNKDYGGPYCTVNASVADGDIVTVVAENLDSFTNEQGFMGTQSICEWYYSYDKLYCWPNTNILKNSETYGPPDTIIATVQSIYTITYIGVYKLNTYLFYGRIYSLQITDSTNTKKHDYIPCYRRADNEAGFYDIVTDTFYPNAASDGSSWSVGNSV